MLDISAYVPDLAQLAGLMAAVAVALALIAIGAFVGGRRRLAEADLIAGWGVTVLVFTFAGVATEVPFRLLAYPLLGAGGLALIHLYRRDGRLSADGAGRMAALGVPLLIVTSAMMASQWDEFSQWLWSARYLLEVDGFPRDGLPEHLASFPAYPNGLPLTMYLTSRLAGFFVENSGALFNVFLLLASTLLFARLLSDGLGNARDTRLTYGLCAFGFVVALAFPPFVVPKVTFTAYAEVGTAVTVAFAAILGWRAVEALASEDSARARTLAWQMALAMAVLVNLKQANLVLFVMVCGGVALAGLRTPGVSPRSLARILVLAVVPAIAIYATWRYHVSVNLTAREFTLLPFDQWAIPLLPKTLATMLGIALRKSGYFLTMLVISGIGMRALLRHGGPFASLAIITGTVFLGYNAFLLFAYVAAFGGWEAEHAASYWRYNMHVGVLGGATAVYGLAILWRRHGATRVSVKMGWLMIALALAAPLLLIHKVRFDLHAPKIYVRQVGAELAPMLPAGARVAIVDPLDAGMYAKMMRYEIYRSGKVVSVLKNGLPLKWLRQRLDESRPDFAWVHTQDAAVRTVFQAELPAGSSYLLKASDQGWRVIRSWPYPGYELPTDIPD
jgi:hypothetical protein